MLKTIQMTIDETMLTQVDYLVAELDMTRSAFIRAALESALKTHHLRELRKQDERGYRLNPPRDEEVEEWEAVLEWGDEWNVAK